MKMRMFHQKKLWRDKAVAMLEQTGSRIHWRHLNDSEYDQQLRLKLGEEAAEVCAAQTHDELIGELADIFEVINALCALHGLTRDAIIKAQEKKSIERGGFAERMYVEVAEHPEGSYGAQYCLAQPDKYPEIMSELE